MTLLADLTSPTMPDVSSSGLVVWTTIITILILAIGTITDKGFGPISRAWFDFAKRRREATAAREAGDIASLRRSVSNLLALREADAERLTHLEATVLAYTEWGFEIQQIAGRNGWKLPPPPRPKTN